jgi:ubiquinone biosynthesis protein
MDLLRTGIGLSKTIKNVTRFREIITVFWKNGFDEFILKTNLHSKIPGFVLPKKRFENLEFKEGQSFWASLGYRLRLSFEELGAGFIKVGQLLSTREDILHPDLIQELKKLQNKVKPIEFSIAKKEIEKALGKNIEEVFSEIDEVPIGVASIGIVYAGKLKTGEEVVLKVRRPNIEETLDHDFEIISFIVSQLERVSDEIKFLGVSRAIDDFFNSIQIELNFNIERNNCKKLQENLKKLDTDNIFKIPTMYSEYSSTSLLIMEKLDGTPFNNIPNILEKHPEVEEKLMKAIRMFVQTILADGFFHADLHGGNFFLMNDGKIGLIDFGLMGSLSRKNRSNLVAILFALFTSNYENLVFEFLDVADYDVIPNHEELQKDIRVALEPYLGLTVQEIDVTFMVNAIVTTLSKHQIYLPREWFVIFRSLMTLDGVGKSIGIDLNIFEVLDGQLEDVMKELLSKESLIEDAAWIGRDTLNSFRTIPRQLKWMLKEFTKRKYTFDIKLQGFQRDIRLISKSIYFLGLMILSSIFIFSGVFLVKDQNYYHFEAIPGIVWIFWGLGLMSVLRASAFIRKK